MLKKRELKNSGITKGQIGANVKRLHKSGQNSITYGVCERELEFGKTEIAREMV